MKQPSHVIAESNHLSIPLAPLHDSASALELYDLTRRFGKKRAVDHLSFSLASGEIFGLLGPNGAGKSTCMKMLTTLLPPTSGTARVAGFDIIKESSDVRRNIGYVPQMLSADGMLTAYENLMLSARLYHMPKNQRQSSIDEALAFMGLTDVADKLVRTYSGGMIRRLELAQAMLHRPSILFLDEPTIGLDPVARRLVWNRLLDVKKLYGMTLFMTTHDMEEADQLCDLLAILHQGKVAVMGTPQQLKSAIGTQATLHEVFVKYCGGSMTEGGDYQDVRKTRNTVTRLG